MYNLLFLFISTGAYQSQNTKAPFIALAPPWALSSQFNPTAITSGKSKLQKPCSFHLFMINTSFKNKLKEHPNFCLKGKQSNNE